MSAGDQFLGEIRIFPSRGVPSGWMACNGQLLDIKQNTALFSLLGTYYGGDGKTTFGLPDMRGAVPMHTSDNYVLGESGGSDNITLLESEMPNHVHLIATSYSTGTDYSPAGEQLARAQGLAMYAMWTPPAVNEALDQRAVAATGGNQPHNNLQPYLTLNFCIAVQGIYPSRS
jgi:microcystin-dependent protein